MFWCVLINTNDQIRFDKNESVVRIEQYNIYTWYEQRREKERTNERRSKQMSQNKPHLVMTWPTGHTLHFNTTDLSDNSCKRNKYIWHIYTPIMLNQLHLTFIYIMNAQLCLDEEGDIYLFCTFTLDCWNDSTSQSAMQLEKICRVQKREREKERKREERRKRERTKEM